MPLVSNRRRLAALLAGALALVGTPALAGPAQAAPVATVTVRMVNAGGIGVAGVDVSASKGTSVVGFGVTDANGYITLSAGQGSTLTAGTWRFSYLDFDTARGEAGVSYYRTNEERPLTNGSNNLGSLPMRQSSAASGTLVGAMSNTLLKNVEFRAKKGTEAATSPAITLADGKFQFGRLLQGHYSMEYKFGRTWLPVRSFDLTADGQQVSMGPVGVVVKPSTKSLIGTSPAKGGATLTFKVDGKKYGAPNPQGTIVVKVGSKTQAFAVAPQSNGVGKAVATFTGLSKGSKTFSVEYQGNGFSGGGDIASFKTSVAVVVK